MGRRDPEQEEAHTVPGHLGSAEFPRRRSSGEEVLGDHATVFVVDEHLGTRAALGRLIASAGLTAATFPCVEAFLREYTPQTPGCLVLAPRTPGMGGLELLKGLCAAGVAIPIIFLAAHAEVPMVVRAMKAGAVDFVDEPYDDADLLRQLRRALCDDAQPSRDRASRAAARARLSRLTPRERQVLDGLVSGGLSREIATRLGVTKKTIEAHRANMMRKTAVANSAELIRLALVAAPTEGAASLRRRDAEAGSLAPVSASPPAILRNRRPDRASQARPVV